MNKKKVYNKGIESGLKVAQKVIEQEVEAMEYLKSKIDLIDEGHDEMKFAVNQLIEDADENAIINIFGICNRVKPAELKDHEKKIVLNVLATLSTIGQNERQKKYQNNIRHHLNVQGYEPELNYDFSQIKSLESVSSIKVIAKVVRIFLYLQDLNMDGVYRHEDDLFTYFELRSFDEIDALVELLFCLFGEDGLIELYGDFSGEFKQKDLRYLNVTLVENLEVSYECAQIYFKDCYDYDNNKQYVESSSYVIYSADDKIVSLHKKTGVKTILLEEVEDAGDYIRRGKIATFSDMGYYVLGNDLYFIDLKTLDTGFIFRINVERDSDGNLYEVMKLCVYNSQMLIYENGLNYIVDLEEGKDSVREILLGSNLLKEGNYFLKGDYIYFIDEESYRAGTLYYVVKKYGILNDEITVVSKVFGRKNNVLYAPYGMGCKLIHEGMYENYYCCVFQYFEGTTLQRTKVECYYINVDYDGSAEMRNFYMRSMRGCQISQNKSNLIYVLADKSCSLISHDFLSDKKKVLLEKYGEVKKPTISQRFSQGKSTFRKPYDYMCLSKWIWTKKHDNSKPEIIAL